MTYMSSTASNDGTLAITVFFKLGTQMPSAAANVQNRVAQAAKPVACRSCSTNRAHHRWRSGARKRTTKRLAVTEP